LITETQTIFKTSKVFEDGAAKPIGEFKDKSIKAGVKVSILASGDADLAGWVSAEGAHGEVVVDAAGAISVAGVLPEGADADVIAATSKLHAKKTLSLSAGGDLALARSAELKIDGSPAAGKDVTLDAGGDLSVRGEVISLDETKLEAAGDVFLGGVVKAGSLIDVKAGKEDGSGSVTSDIYADLILTPSGGDVVVAAGSTSGDVRLTDLSARRKDPTDLSATLLEKVTLQAAAGLVGQVGHYGEPEGDLGGCGDLLRRQH
jgi:hypothetical protein